MSNYKDPIVDFGTSLDDILNGSMTEDKKKSLGEEILEAFETSGYVYLKNFGKFEDWLNEYRACGDAFLDLPMETKKKYTRSLKDYHGYAYQEEETPEGCPKVHETLDITNVERTPEEIPNHKECARYGMKFLQAFSRIIFTALELALEYPTNFLNDRVSFNNYEKNIAQIRFIRYPPLEDADANRQRFVTHKDYGAFTFLFLDEAGGLELKPHNGDWMEANYHIPNSVLLISGSMTAFLTNGRIQAVDHKVVSKNLDKYRRSVVFFSVYDSDVLLISPNEPSTEESLTVKEFFKQSEKDIYKKESS